MGEMEPIVKKYEEYKKAKTDLQEAKDIVELESDEELRDQHQNGSQRAGDKVGGTGVRAEDSASAKRPTTTRKTLSLKSGREPAVRKRLCSLRISCGCTCGMQNVTVGRPS